MGWDSQGYEIGNVLARGTFPAARIKRPGPPPASQQTGDDPFAVRGAPIRARPFAFHMRQLTARAVVASPHYVGPGLIKSLTLTNMNLINANPIPHFNLLWNTTPYVTATNLGLDPQPPGTPIWETGAADNQPADFTQEGGLDTIGQVIFAPYYLLDYYIPERDFYLGFTMRNQTAAGGVAIGSVLVYEGVLASDFPSILG